MKSFRQMTNEGMIKRADAEKIGYEDLHVEPGFNVDGRTDAENDADDDALLAYIASGGRIPDLEVRPREEGGVWIVDGHRRHKQIGRAIAAGQFLPDPKSGKYLIPIKQFVGNDLDRLVRIGTSNEGKKLTPIQLAGLYKRAAAFGLTSEEIAQRFNRPKSHVENILVLSNANHDVQQMVGAGEVSATIAINTVRKKGERAGPELKQAHDKAKAAGRKKLTAATLAPKPTASQSDALNAARWRFFCDKMDLDSIEFMTAGARESWDSIIDQAMEQQNESFKPSISKNEK